MIKIVTDEIEKFAIELGQMSDSVRSDVQKVLKNTGFKSITHMHAGLQWYNLLPCYLRESLAVLKMFVLG